MQTGVIYARYSCEKQTNNSILGQVRECEEFARKNDIQIIDIYKDEAISGRTAEKRPAFMKMIKDSKTGMFNSIIVWKGDRFSRSRADSAKYKSELRKNGVRVLSATEANLTGPESILMDGINEAFAEYFSVELAAKVERGMTQNVIEGKWNGGPMPLGYKKDENGKIVIDESTSYIVREIFDMFNDDINQLSTYGIYLKLLEKGYRLPNGKEIPKVKVYHILNNEKYYGHYGFKGTYNDNVFPPIVTKEEFEKAQAKLNRNRHLGNKMRARERFLLRHILFCGECGKEFKCVTGTSKTKKQYFYYVHDEYGCDFYQKWDKRAFEDAIVTQIVNNLRNTSFRDDVVAQMKVNIAKSLDNTKHLRAELDDTNKRIENLSYALEEGKNEVSVLLPRLKQLQERKLELEAEIRKNGSLNLDKVEEQANDLFDAWCEIPTMTLDQKANLISTWIDFIEIFANDQVVLHYKAEMYGNYLETITVSS